jgi:hypothetical protein
MPTFLTLILTLFFLTAQTIMAAEVNCPKLSVAEGPIEGHKDYSVGKLKQIESSMDSFWCSPILFKGKPVVWVENFVKAGNSFYGFKCKLNDKSQDESNADLSTDLSKLLLNEAGDVGILKVDLPGFGMLANPTFCGSLLAYWGIVRLKEGYLLHGLVYDLEKAKVIEKKAIGKDNAATGDRSYYAQPVFDMNRKKITFPPNKISTHIKGVSIQLP